MFTGCNDSIKFEALFSSGSITVINTFGEMVDENGIETAAHYVTVQIDPNLAIRAPTSGRMYFEASLDGLSNAVVILPKLRDEDDATDVSTLDKFLREQQEYLCIVFANLQLTGATGLESRVTQILTDNGFDEHTPADGAKGFLNTHADADVNSDVKKIPVWADPEVTSQGKTWSVLGNADGGVLQVAMFVWKDHDDDDQIEDGERSYINPMPYLAAIPMANPAAINNRTPEIAEVWAEFANDASFGSPGEYQLFDHATGAMNTGAAIDGHARLLFRLKNPADDANPAPANLPYEISYELRQAGSPDPIIRSKGVFHFNQMPSENTTPLATYKQNLADIFFRKSPAVNHLTDLSNNGLWIHLPLKTGSDRANPTPEVIDPARGSGYVASIDTDELDGAVAVYPDGDYTLDILVANAHGVATAVPVTVQFRIGEPNVEFAAETHFERWTSGQTLDLTTLLAAPASVTSANLDWTIVPDPGADFDPATGVLSHGAAGRSYTVTATHKVFTTLTDTLKLNIVQLDLAIDGLAEAVEDGDGAYLLLNDDDDNANGTADRLDAGQVVGENDLEPLNLVFAGSTSGTVTLSAPTGAGRIAVWTQADRQGAIALPKSWTIGADAVPPNLFAEGSSLSGGQADIQLRLDFTANAIVFADTALASVVQLTLVTPAGDPTTTAGAVDGGNGTGAFPPGSNEFTYSTANPGVLTIPFRATVAPAGANLAAVAKKVTFTMANVDQAPTWNAANPGGQASVSAGELVADCTFTGLPMANNDFGAKDVSMRFGGNPVTTGEVEVFWPMLTNTAGPRNDGNFPSNHPGSNLRSAAAENNGAGPGPRAPNWFFYWRQVVHNGAETRYAGTQIPGFGRTPSVRWFHTGYTGIHGRLLIGEIAQGTDVAGGVTTGIDAFDDTVQHEFFHSNDQSIAFTNAAFGLGVGSATNVADNHWSFNIAKPGVIPAPPLPPGRVYNHFIDNNPADGDFTDPGEDLDTDGDSVINAVDVGGAHTIEGDAGAAEPDNEHHLARRDWGDPGKNHQTRNDHTD